MPVITRRRLLATALATGATPLLARAVRAQSTVKVGSAVLGDYAIGVTRAGATTWVFARMVAKKEGWDPDKDVQVVGLGGLDAQLAAMARKEIAAYVWGDGGAVTELQGKSKVLMRLDSVTPRWIS